MKFSVMLQNYQCSQWTFLMLICMYWEVISSAQLCQIKTSKTFCCFFFQHGCFSYFHKSMTYQISVWLRLPSLKRLTNQQLLFQDAMMVETQWYLWQLAYPTFPECSSWLLQHDQGVSHGSEVYCEAGTKICSWSTHTHVCSPGCLKWGLSFKIFSKFV